LSIFKTCHWENEFVFLRLHIWDTGHREEFHSHLPNKRHLRNCGCSLPTKKKSQPLKLGLGETGSVMPASAMPAAPASATPEPAKRQRDWQRPARIDRSRSRRVWLRVNVSCRRGLNVSYGWCDRRGRSISRARAGCRSHRLRRGGCWRGSSKLRLVQHCADNAVRNTLLL
jgi:hypothetical protein